LSRRFATALLALTTVFGTTLLTARPAAAAGTCSGKVTKYPELRFDAFVGHRIVADNKFCFPQAAGTAGPYWGVSGTTTPTITFPSRIPAGGGEPVELVSGPTSIYGTTSRHTYRISVEQGPAWVPVKQTFTFGIHYYAVGNGRICFAGGACGPYSS
jgi:hypothetical protein